MKYRINEIFYSLQGEGFWTGTPSIFIRFSGCNLKCSFCDTNHLSGKNYSLQEIWTEIKNFPANHVILTGGEPALQLDENLIDFLHQKDKYICIETNGTQALPKNIDWITCSPKNYAASDLSYRANIKFCNELKIVFSTPCDLSIFDSITTEHKYIQPCDVEDEDMRKEYIKNSINYCLEHPEWHLSLQTHKFLSIK